VSDCVCLGEDHHMLVCVYVITNRFKHDVFIHIEGLHAFVARFTLVILTG